MKDIFIAALRDSAGRTIRLFVRQFINPFPVFLFVHNDMIYHAVAGEIFGVFRRTVRITGRDVDGAVLTIEMPMLSGELGAFLQKMIGILSKTGSSSAKYSPRMFVYCPVSEEGVFQRIDELSAEELGQLRQNLDIVEMNAIFSRSLAEVRSDYIWLEHVYEQMKIICMNTSDDPHMTTMKDILKKVMGIRPKMKAKHEELAAKKGG